MEADRGQERKPDSADNFVFADVSHISFRVERCWFKAPRMVATCRSDQQCSQAGKAAEVGQRVAHQEGLSEQVSKNARI
jgi:hypothetical protein